MFLKLFKTNANTVGGGLPVLTGPGFVDKNNAATVAEAGRGRHALGHAVMPPRVPAGASRPYEEKERITTAERGARRGRPPASRTSAWPTSARRRA